MLHTAYTAYRHNIRIGTYTTPKYLYYPIDQRTKQTEYDSLAEQL